MIKFIFLLANIISNNIFKPYEEDNNIIEVEVSEEIEGAIDIIDGYHIIFEDSKYYVLNGQQKIECKSMPIVKRIDENIYIGFNDGDDFKIFLYNIYGNLLEKNVLNNINGKCDFQVFNGELLLVGSSDETTGEETKKMCNLFTYNVKTKKYKYYGGILNEKYLFSDIYENNLYICFYKDSLTYGDFGTGGYGEDNITVVSIDENFDIIKYTVLDLKENVVNFKVRRNIIIETDNNIISLTHDLLVINTFIKDESIKKIFIGELKIYLFYDEEIVILNNDNLFMYDTVQYNLNGKMLLEYDGTLYIKKDKLYYFDIIDLNKWKCFEKYYKEEELDTVYTIYGKAKFIEKKCKSFFNENIFGLYEFDIQYETQKGVIFCLYLKQSIAEEFNVCDSMTYPLGYRLLFNGNAYLDGKAIVNNYPVSVAGKHKLTIYGNGKEMEINFNISEVSLVFNDMIYNEYDICVNVNEKLVVEYLFNCSFEDIVIREIVCNRKVKSYELNENILSIEIENYDELGLDQIYFDKIIYEKQGVENEIIINKVLNVLVKNRNIAMNVSGLIDGKINFEALESVGQIRGIKLIFTSINGDCYEYVSLGDSFGEDIIVRGIKDGEYELTINVVKYNTDGYQNIELCKGNITIQENSFKFGEILCYQDGDREVLDVKIDREVIKSYSNLLINDKKVYENKRINYEILLITGVISLVIFFIISRFLKKKYFKKYK